MHLLRPPCGENCRSKVSVIVSTLGLAVVSACVWCNTCNFFLGGNCAGQKNGHIVCLFFAVSCVNPY